MVALRLDSVKTACLPPNSTLCPPQPPPPKWMKKSGYATGQILCWWTALCCIESVDWGWPLAYLVNLQVVL